MDIPQIAFIFVLLLFISLHYLSHNQVSDYFYITLLARIVSARLAVTRREGETRAQPLPRAEDVALRRARAACNWPSSVAVAEVGRQL